MAYAPNEEPNPTVDERLATWLAARPEMNRDLATSLFRTHEYRNSAMAIRVVHGILEPTPPPPAPVPLVDDGLDDLVWSRKHPDRRFRVRPWRSEDGEPQVRPGHCITVFDVIRKMGAWGVPIDALHRVGMGVVAEDSDLYAELFLLVRSASKGFREHRPEVAQ